MNRVMFVAFPLLLASAVAAQARAPNLKWMDATAVGLPAGAKIAVVSGDPSKDGPFVVRIQMPANYTIPPHHHPTDEVVRITTAGALTYGTGDKVDPGHSGKLEKGWHITMQANMNHWVTTSDPLIVQVNGNGPFAITYVNPADDPRKK